MNILELSHDRRLSKAKDETQNTTNFRRNLYNLDLDVYWAPWYEFCVS
jgi:hypothetical protein